MKNIFKTIKSWFVKPEKNEVEKETHHINDDIEIHHLSDVIGTNDVVIDVSGNTLQVGDSVILLAYNDKRRNYMTIPANYCAIPYTKDITSDFISVNSYINSNCWESRRKGFIHIGR
jgi:hypothetical protein